MTWNAQGQPGVPGAQGGQGVQGIPGPFPATLPAGQMLTGTYEIDGTNSSGGTSTSIAGGAISFQFRLAAAPTPHFVAVSATPPSECPGTAVNPTALSGNLCVFEAVSKGKGSMEFFNSSTGENGASVFGAGLVMFSTGVQKSCFSDGTWAVTG